MEAEAGGGAVCETGAEEAVFGAVGGSLKGGMVVSMGGTEVAAAEIGSAADCEPMGAVTGSEGAPEAGAGGGGWLSGWEV